MKYSFGCFGNLLGIDSISRYLFSVLKIRNKQKYFFSEQNEQNFDRAMLASFVVNYSFVVWREEFSVDVKLQRFLARF